MNTGEIDRIATAINVLRPDWPVSSLRTLLARPELAYRPRRDVAVALAWVACESTSITPARVIEQGPWWTAAAIESKGIAPTLPTSGNACWTCGRAYRSGLADDGRTDTCCDSPARRPEHGADPKPYLDQIRQEIRR